MEYRYETTKLLKYAAITAVILQIAASSASGSETSDFDFAKAMFDRCLYQVSYQYFNDYLTKYPESYLAGEAQYYIGESLYVQTNYKGALAEFRRVPINTPYSPATPRALIRIGDCLAKTGETDRAISAYNKAIVRSINDEDIFGAYVKLGNLYFDRQEYTEANEIYTKYITKYGESEYCGILYFRIAATSYIAGDINLAINSITKASIYENTDTPILNYLKGKIYLEANDYIKARESFEIAATTTSNEELSADSQYMLGLADFATSDFASVTEIAAELANQTENANAKSHILYLLGYSQYMIGDWEGARSNFEECKKQLDDNDISMGIELLIGDCYFEERDLTNAERIYKSVSESDTIWRYQAIYRMAWTAFDNNDMSMAYKRFEAAQEDKDLKPYCLYWQAECLSRNNKKTAAISLLDELIQSYPNCTLADNALFFTAKLHLNRGDNSTGLGRLEQIIENYKDSDLKDDAAYMIARTHYKSQNSEKALSEYDMFTTEYADSPYVVRAYFDKGLVYFERGDYANAEEAFLYVTESYIESDYFDDAIYKIGECKCETGQYNDAIEQFRKLTNAEKYTPLKDKALYQIEYCRYKMGYYKNIRELNEKFISKYPSNKLNADLYLDLIDRYKKSGNTSKAIKYYELAEISTSNAEKLYQIRRDLAQLYIDTGDYDNGKAVLLRIARERNGIGKDAALFNLAQLSDGIGDTNSVLSYYGTIISDYPTSVYREKAMLDAGQKMRKLKMYYESNTTLLRFVQEYPESKDITIARFYIAFNYQRIGEYSEAKKYHLLVTKYGRRSLAVQSYYWLGICELDSGNVDAASRYFTKVATNYQDFPDWVKKAKSELNKK